MNKKGIILLAVLLVGLFAVGIASAVDNSTDDATEVAMGIDDNAAEINGMDETKEENFDDELGDSPATYSDLAEEIGKSGNITLTHENYIYNEGAEAIIITEDDKAIDGNGAVIDMKGSAIQAFNILASGVAIKNLTIKNVNFNRYGGAIFFFKSGTLTNCNFINNSATAGGAVFFDAESICTLTNCNFINNSAASGGAVTFNINSVVTLTKCNFINNFASENSGAIYSFDDGINVTDCNFTDNSASGDNGAIYIIGSGTVSKCNFINNSASGNNGAINIISGTVSNCNFVNNSASGNHGAVDIGSGTVSNCNFTDNSASTDCGAVYLNDNGNVIKCNFTNNTANCGGAVYFMNEGNVINCNFINNSGQVGGAFMAIKNCAVTNCTFTDNSAYAEGGATNINYGTVTNCTFTDNSASGDGGAIFMESGNVINCYFSGNNASKGGAILSYHLQTITVDTCIFKTDSDSTYRTYNLPPALNVGNFTSFYGSGERLTFDLKTNISSIPVTNGNISISVYFKDNSSWICNYSCLSGKGWIPDLSVGSYYAIFDTEYAEFKPINRTITIAIPDIPYYINVTSLTANNKTVNITAESNIPENLFWDGKLLFILPNGKNITAKYASNGIWWAVHTFEDYDDYNISATYPGLGNATVKNATISITKVDSAITIDKVVFTYGDSNVTVKTEGADGITAKIDGNDVAAAGFTIPISGLNIGNHTLTVTTIADEDHNPVTKTVNITVNKADCILIVNDVELYYGDSKNVTVTAEGAVNITAKIDGNNVTVTGFTIPISGLNPGTHTLTVTAVPDENHTEVTGNATITVNRLKTELTGNPITTTYDVNRYLVITLKDVYGNPLSGNTVLVDLNGVKTYTTDNNGQAKVPTKALAAKVYTARITFDGNAKYEKSSMDVKVTVNKAANPLKVKGKTLKVKFSKLKKKAVKVKVTKVVKFTKKGVGTLTYKKVKGNKKIAINKKTGKVTIKKGLKKGTYKVKMKIKANGNANYNPSAFKTITLKIKVK